MKIKPVFVGILAITVLLAFLSLTTISKILSANPRQVFIGVSNSPLAANILPKRSPMWISLLVKPEKLELFAELAAEPSDRREVRQELAAIKQRLQQNWLLDYKTDIQPWFDQEIALAVTDLDLDAQANNGLQTGYLLAFTIKDKSIAKTSMNAFWQRLAIDGADLNFEQYQGLPIISNGVTDHQPAIASTVLDKFVLFANDPKVLHQAIATFQNPVTSIANLDSYRDQLESLNKDKQKSKHNKAAVAYFNLAELGEDLPQESLLINLSFDKLGIKAKTTLTLTNRDQTIGANLSKSAKSKSSSDIIKRIPSASSIIIGHNLDQTLENLQNILPDKWQQSISKRFAPITINQDALAFISDEYAIAVLPTKTLPTKTLPTKINENLDWLLIAKKTANQNTKMAIADLDSSARSKYTVGEIFLNTQPITVWTELTAITNSDNFEVSGNVVIAHTQTKDYLYLSNSLTVLESALNINNNQAIATSKDFKNAISPLSKDRKTYAYLNKSLSLSYLKNILPNLNQDMVNLPFNLINKKIKSIALSDISTNQNLQNYEAILVLK
jgi:hypothetical protein